MGLLTSLFALFGTAKPKFDTGPELAEKLGDLDQWNSLSAHRIGDISEFRNGPGHAIG